MLQAKTNDTNVVPSQAQAQPQVPLTASPAEACQVHQETFKLASTDGMRLHVYSWTGALTPDKVVIVIHGMGGHSGYYNDSLAPYLVPTGAAVYAPDLRGHGHSEGSRGDIPSFEHYQRDVEAVVRWARLRHPGLPVFLLGESMGTSIAIVYAACATAEIRPDGLILVACVVAPTLKPRFDEFVRTFWYASHNRLKVVLPITGREEQGIRDMAFVKVLKTDALFNRYVSVRFLTSMTSNMSRAARLHKQLHLPVLLLQGGLDITVRHRPTRTFFKRIAATDKEMYVFPEAFHAILNDPDAPLVRRRILDWLQRQTTNHSQTTH